MTCRLAKLSARVRVFTTGQGRRTDPVDAHSAAVGSDVGSWPEDRDDVVGDELRGVQCLSSACPHRDGERAGRVEPQQEPLLSGGVCVQL